MSGSDRLVVHNRLRAIVTRSGDAVAAAELETLIANQPTPASSQRIVDARETRDHELREAALALRGKPVISLHAEFSRYVSSAWPRDRLLDEMPLRYVGTLKAHFFRAMKAHPRAPGRRQLSNIISGNDRDVQIASEVGDDHGSEGENDEIHQRSRRRANGSA